MTAVHTISDTGTDADVDADLLALVEDFFGAESGADAVTAAETGAFPAALWTAADEIGLTGIGLPEELGGAGGTVREAMAVLAGSGRHAVPLPLLESWLAGRARTAAGGRIGGGPETFAPGSPEDTLRLDGGRVTGTLHGVAWGRHATRVLALPTGDGLLALDPATAVVRPRPDLAGMPRDDLTFDGADAEAIALPDAWNRLAPLAELGRAAQLAGAIDAAFALTRTYVGQREQFGRPIARFQAVQQHVVTLAQAATTALHAVDRAALAFTRVDAESDAELDAQAAKIVAAEMADLAITAAHQAHGAIGMTREYRLQQFTRRLMQWRADLGDARSLAEHLGRVAAAAPSLAHLITAAPGPARTRIEPETTR